MQAEDDYFSPMILSFSFVNCTCSSAHALSYCTAMPLLRHHFKQSYCSGPWQAWQYQHGPLAGTARAGKKQPAVPHKALCIDTGDKKMCEQHILACSEPAHIHHTLQREQCPATCGLCTPAEVDPDTWPYEYIYKI